MANVYQMVTDRITSQLEQGNIPWRKPWTGASVDKGGAINYVSRHPYSLINQMLLGKPGEYLTWKQVEELGGKVKKGAKAGMVVFYTKLAIKDVTDYLSRQPRLRFQNDKPSNRAYYSPSQDMVVVPMLSQYGITAEYYSTAFHELTHSTIPADRCDRVTENTNAFFGNEDYSREALEAEIGSAMLCNRVGIDCEKAFRNSVAYIQGWLNALKNDPKMIVWAAGRAEKAAKFILNEF